MTAAAAAPQVDLDRYQGYLRPHLEKIIAAYEGGDSLVTIANRLGLIPSAWGGTDYYPTSSNLLYALRRVGYPVPPPKPAGPSWAERLRRAAVLRDEGKTMRQIGVELGVSGERARQILGQAERLGRHAIRGAHNRAIQRAASLRGPGRPVDLGGPRDVWLTFRPTTDPRFAFMEPVGADDIAVPAPPPMPPPAPSEPARRAKPARPSARPAKPFSDALPPRGGRDGWRPLPPPAASPPYAATMSPADYQRLAQAMTQLEHRQRLDGRPAIPMRYVGLYVVGNVYEIGEMVRHGTELWVARTLTTALPGENPQA
jgi:hypothetical protein